MKIDKVYLINLDKSKDRLEQSDFELKKLGGIFKEYQRVSAVDGKQLSEEYIKSITTQYSYYFLNNPRDTHYQFDTKGGIGCALSHIKVWKDMIDNNYENIIVFEDNFTIDDIEKFNKTLYNIPKEATIGYFFYGLFHDNMLITKINDYWKIIDDLYVTGTRCYFLNIKLAKDLLKNSFPIEIHIDFYINFYCINNNVKRYYVYNNVINNSKFTSIINHGGNVLLITQVLLLNYNYIILVLLIIILVYIKFNKIK